MQRVPAVVGSVMAVGLLAGAVALDRQRSESPQVEVAFGDSNGLPQTIDEGHSYVASFDISWKGPVRMRDGSIAVFASRRGDTSEDAPEGNWPLVCKSEFDDVGFRQRVSCAFEAPGPGEFALQLEVRNDEDVVIGEALYTHLVVDPSTTTAPPSGG